MKTPKEIKKGLELCSNGDMRECLKCPYPIGFECFENPMKDALAYIQQLESRLAQIEREKKAMLHDMSKYTMCGACKRLADGDKCPQNDSCVYGEIGRFEWRGVCEENTKED